jgi:hypothetical protein
MKVNIEIDCTPEEARAFMGLPDVSKANSVYVDTMTKAMKGVSSPEQLQEFAAQLAPMGQAGLKMFQSFIEGGMQGMQGGFPGSAGKSSKRSSDD